MQPIKDRYFDDWSQGEVFESESHLMTEERTRSFAEEFDPQPFHVDPETAAARIYGGLIASGWHTGSVMIIRFRNEMPNQRDEVVMSMEPALFVKRRS